MRESVRTQSVQSPVIPIIAELIRTHPGTISLGQGVVHYGPPRQAIDAIPGFLADVNNHKYQAVHGVKALIEPLERKLASENGIPINTAGSRLFVTAGGNMAFMNAVLAVADPGDEVILLKPCYFNHEMAVRLADCKPVLVATNENYQPRVETIRDAITPRTRAVVTVSPNNPTGAVYPEATLRAINMLCHERGIYHIHDEVYEYFTWDGARHYSPASAPGTAPHTITINSLSKAYGFASWRVGYMLAPVHLFEGLRKVQDTVLVCPPVISQYAAAGALRAGRAWCREQIKSIAEVRAVVGGELAKIYHRCTVPRADGAFYYLMRLDTKMDAMTLVERLIRECGVAVMPGTTFGMEPDKDGCYLRVSYGALTKETAAAGVSRLVKGLRAILSWGNT